MDSTQVTEYERALVATALKHDEGVNALLQLEPVDFYNPYCKLIAQTIKEMFLSNVPIDMVTVTNSIPLAEDGSLDRGWWRVHITDLALAYDYHQHSLHYYSGAIREASTRRKLARINKKFAQELAESDAASAQLIAIHLQEIATLTAQGEGERLQHVSAITADAVLRIKERELNPAEIIGAPTGLYEYDCTTTGFQPGQLVLIGARPSMGKSSLALCWAAHMAITCGMYINFFSLEMSKFTLIQKLIALLTGVDTNKLRTGVGIHSHTWDSIDRAIHSINKSGLYIADETSRIRKVSDIKARRNEQKLSGVKTDGDIIDHIGLLYPEKDLDNRVQAVSEISRDLKTYSAEEQLFTVALCQLGRQVEQRQDKRPMLSDLRESGTLEQDADIVTFIYRDEYYNKESDKRGEAELIIAKQREGATGTVHVLYDQNTQHFCNKLGVGPGVPAPPIPQQTKAPEPVQTNFEPPAESHDVDEEIMLMSEAQINALLDSRGVDVIRDQLGTEWSRVTGGKYEAEAEANFVLANDLINKRLAPTAPPSQEPCWYDSN